MSAVVTTRQGKVQGLELAGCTVFRGIPYAAPPVDERRWLAPTLPEPWSGIRPADGFGPASLQPPRVAGSVFDLLGVTDTGPESEDCLYLNVFTPGVDDARRPVLVWIHGGAFSRGTGASPLYDGSTLARRGDVVVVTINYRLGALGFLNLAEVTRGRIPATGNEGLLDQVAALAWVRDNVRAFGGDPDRVTIFGESAGGMSCGALLALPAARGLFRGAIPQSGASSTAHPLPRAARVAERLLDALAIRSDDAKSLRALDARRLIEVGTRLGLSGDREIGAMIFQPVIDGGVLAELPLDAVRKGSADVVSVLVGSTLEEWRLFSAMEPRGRELDEAALHARLARSVAETDLRPLAGRYREIRGSRGAPAGPRAILDALETDRVFRLPGVRLAEGLAARGAPAWQYCVTWPSPAFGGALGACHAIELGFLFGSYDLGPGPRQFFGAGESAAALAETMQDAWLAFARTGNPACERLGAWPAYTAGQRATMMLGEKCALEHAPLEDERRAWEGLPDGTTLGRL